jgi:hypothetical protein
MAEKPTDSSSTSSTDRVRVASVTNDRVTLEFQIEDIIKQLARKVEVLSCMGCKGCMAASFSQQGE